LSEQRFALVVIAARGVWCGYLAHAACFLEIYLPLAETWGRGTDRFGVHHFVVREGNRRHTHSHSLKNSSGPSLSVLQVFTDLTPPQCVLWPYMPCTQLGVRRMHEVAFVRVCARVRAGMRACVRVCARVRRYA